MCGGWRRGGGGAAGELEVGEDHFFDEGVEGVGGGPGEVGAGFGGVADEEFDFGGAAEAFVDGDVLAVVEAGLGEGGFAEFADGVGLAGGDDVVVGLGLLEHGVHGADVVGGVAPVALGFEVAQREGGGAAELDAGDGGGDFAGDELEAAAGGLVVEEDAGAAEHAVGFAVVAGEFEAGDLGDAVGAAGVEGGGFALRDFADLAEHFGGAGEVEAAAGAELLDGGEHVVGAVDVGVHGGESVGEAFGDEGLGGEVVAFVEVVAADDLVDGGVAFEGGGVQGDLVDDVGDASEAADGVFDGDATDEAVDFVAEGEEVLGEVGAVLSGDAGDEGFFGHGGGGPVLGDGARCGGMLPRGGAGWEANLLARYKGAWQDFREARET